MCHAQRQESNKGYQKQQMNLQVHSCTTPPKTAYGQCAFAASHNHLLRVQA